MKKQVLSFAIALPTLLLSAVPSLAGTTTATPVKNENNKIAPARTVQPIQVKPGQVETIKVGNPEDTHSPGPNGIKPRGGTPPRPPRREIDGIIKVPVLDRTKVQPGT